MAVVGHLHKIVFGGRLATSETWSVGIHFLTPDAGVIPPTAFLPALTDWIGRTTSKVNATAMLDWIKCNEINPATGKYLDEGVANTHFLVAGLQGAGAGGVPQLTAAVSTVTALARGRASKGRFFPPTGGVESGIGADGRIVPSIALDMATSAAQLITDLNGSAVGECVVFSRIGQLTEEIQACRVGRVCDTQQRRRRNLVEDHQLVPVS